MPAVAAPRFSPRPHENAPRLPKNDGQSATIGFSFISSSLVSGQRFSAPGFSTGFSGSNILLKRIISSASRSPGARVRGLFGRARADSAAHLLFLSSCPEPWGGSEELWAGAARRLCRAGYRVSACKTLVVPTHPRIEELRGDGIVVEDYWGFPPLRSLAPLSAGLLRGAAAFTFRAVSSRLSARPAEAESDAKSGAGTNFWKRALLSAYQQVFLRRLRGIAPDFAVISQGENFDGLHYAESCRSVGIPYVLICQKASDLNWPPDSLRGAMTRAFQGAHRVYFVSEHNRALTERQLARRLANAEVVRNPFLTGRRRSTALSRDGLRGLPPRLRRPPLPGGEGTGHPAGSAGSGEMEAA